MTLPVGQIIELFSVYELYLYLKFQRVRFQ